MKFTGEEKGVESTQLFVHLESLKLASDDGAAFVVPASPFTIYLLPSIFMSCTCIILHIIGHKICIWHKIGTLIIDRCANNLPSNSHGQTNVTITNAS